MAIIEDLCHERVGADLPIKAQVGGGPGFI